MAEVLWSDNLKNVIHELKQLEPSEIENKINNDEYLASKSLTKEEVAALHNLYQESKSKINEEVQGTWQ